MKEIGAVMSCDCIQIPLTVFSKCSPRSVFFSHFNRLGQRCAPIEWIFFLRSSQYHSTCTLMFSFFWKRCNTCNIGNLLKDDTSVSCGLHSTTCRIVFLYLVLMETLRSWQCDETRSCAGTAIQT